MHGEGNEVTKEDAERLMIKFCLEMATIREKNAIPLNRIFNADQTGLFYQKLPNRTYCLITERQTVRGVKRMKDKERITVMLYTYAAGDKLPLSFVGTAKKPKCFRFCDNKPPADYTDQKNAWFDQVVTDWWFI